VRQVRTEIGDQARLLHEDGRLKEAATLYERASASRPTDSGLLGLAGSLQIQLGKHALAERLLKRALARQPDHIEARHNLGVAFMKMGRHVEAAACFVEVSRQRPDHVPSLMGLGQTSRTQGDSEAAMAAFRQVLAIEPDNALALGLLGSVVDQAGSPEDAETLLHRAVELRQDDASLHHNLGNVLLRLGKFTPAEVAFRHALALRPDSVAIFTDLAGLLLRLRRTREAVGMLSDSEDMASPPRGLSGFMTGMLLAARTLNCQWEGRKDLLARRLTVSVEPLGPADILFHETSPVVQRRIFEAAAYAQRRPSLPARPFRSRRGQRIRIGYLSSDFQNHPTAYLIAEVFELHDRERFHISAYSVGPDDSGPMRRRIAAGVDEFRELGGLSNEELAEHIAADEPDILIDLKGWTENNRLEALARRPAPIQAAWFGLPATLGADWIDYTIVDHVLAPSGAEAHYTERLVRLPHCYLPTDRRRVIAEDEPRSKFGLPPTGLVLACFCQSMKITPEVFDIWTRALKARPDAMLWLLAMPPKAMTNLRREAFVRGVEPNRLIFAPKIPLEQHLARYRHVDIALDTFPYGSHTTAIDALWAGCPQLAITGDVYAARVSTSIVTAAGLAELAAPSLAAHEKMLLRWCGDDDELTKLRTKTSMLRRDAPLFDTPRFVRSLESAYDQMMERHEAGLPPGDIAIRDFTDSRPVRAKDGSTTSPAGA
jgi:protein O-GlcNAc transferase